MTNRTLGLDVSYWDISFDPAKAAKQIDFVIQRVTLGFQSGKIDRDSALDKLYTGVKKVPIFGAYHYLSSHSDWRSQADFFINVVKDYNYQFYALDFEGAYNQVSSKFNQDANSWMEYVANKTNKKIIFYTNPSLYDTYGYLYCSKWPLWLAQYWKEPSPNKNPGLPKKKSEWLIWQFASEINYAGHGKEYGVGGNSVDLNVFNGTVEEMQKWTNVVYVPIPIPPTEKKGYINATLGLNVRNQPNLLGKKLYALPYKAYVTIYDEKNGWYKISSSLEQWVYAKYITLK